ncbi:MAG: Mrp/NBP35 family ATP-binding protein [bacterium]|nr:Mrp/NBP35 family ATP-binding protein [bacterium]
MAGYHCHGCGEVRPLFPEPTVELSAPSLGSIPFDPALAGGDAAPGGATVQAIAAAAHRILTSLESDP